MQSRHTDDHANQPQNNRVQGRVLLQLARTAIARALGLAATHGDGIDRCAQWLREPGATFVTLTQNGQLRGCIGSLEAQQSLLENIEHNAVAAALHDSRFSPLTAEEFADICIEVSLLSALQPMSFVNETDALARLRPGIDGVMLTYGGHRSTFLPQVWDMLPEAREFMAQLKLKAGLAAHFWHDDIALSRYSVRKWRETDN